MKFTKAMLSLYGITDRSWEKDLSLCEQAELALLGGVSCLQFREKYLAGQERFELALRLKELCSRYGVPFIVNDDVELALACGADGVHVGQSDTEASQARRLLGEGRILGVTAKTVEQAQKAQAAGADYLGSGAVFGTHTKPDAIVLPIEKLKEICQSVQIPVIAIGGITKENLSQLKGAGIAGVALVSAIFSAADIRSECQELRRLTDQYFQEVES